MRNLVCILFCWIAWRLSGSKVQSSDDQNVEIRFLSDRDGLGDLYTGDRGFSYLERLNGALTDVFSQNDVAIIVYLAEKSLDGVYRSKRLKSIALAISRSEEDGLESLTLEIAYSVYFQSAAGRNSFDKATGHEIAMRIWSRICDELKSKSGGA